MGAALLAELEEIGDRLDPTALHVLRRRARRLRYASELSDAIRGEDSGAPALWKQLQDRIGTLHDRHVLAGWLQAQADAAAARGQGGSRRSPAPDDFSSRRRAACISCSSKAARSISPATPARNGTRPRGVTCHPRMLGTAREHPAIMR
jgi:hypothetical protein